VPRHGRDARRPFLPGEGAQHAATVRLYARLTRTAASTQWEWCAVPELIAVAGGHNKVRAIRAVLRGGYATTLITDSVAATGLLDG
jgi:predicted methyltransferase